MTNLMFPLALDQFPPVPQQPRVGVSSPLAGYAYMGGMTAEQRRDQMAQFILGQPAQTIGQGIGQLAAGIGRGLHKYNQAGTQFPTAPGGGSPSFGTSIANFLTGRQNGGLY